MTQADSNSTQTPRRRKRRGKRGRKRCYVFADLETLVDWQLFFSPELTIATHPAGARRMITDSAMDTLLTLANTPNDPRSQTLRQNIRLAVDVAWNYHEEKALETLEVAPSLKRVAEAAVDLRKALSRCPPGANEWLRAAMPANDEDSVAERFANGGIVRVATLADYTTMIAFLAVVAQDAWCMTTKELGKRARPGRPRASSNFTFFLFVNQLLTSVAESGGHFTFTKAEGGRGTLLSALKILSEYLPPGVIPNVLPISRLDRILSHRRASGSHSLKPPSPSNPAIALRAIRQQMEIGIAAHRAGAEELARSSTARQ
jgi:hypothetical protein